MSTGRQQAKEWSRRSARIREQYPTVNAFAPRGENPNGSDSVRAIHDVMLADDRVVLALFGVCAGIDPDATPRRGPRTTPDRQVARAFIRQVMHIEEEGIDFTNEPFPAAFSRLIGDATLNEVAARVDLNRNTVYRLARGRIRPDKWHMEQIAAGYGKRPNYFLEYRIQIITSRVEQELAADPDLSVRLARRLAV